MPEITVPNGADGSEIPCKFKISFSILIIFSKVLSYASYADDTSAVHVSNCESGSAPSVSLDSANQNSSLGGSRYSVRVVTLHVVGPKGLKYQMHPVSSLYCSRMLNRVLGILFAADSREMPREVRSLFKIRKLIS